MKALVIAPQPFFSPRGTPFSVYYRTLVTAEMGVQVDLLTYGEGQDVDIPGVRIFRTPRFRVLGNVKTGPSGLKLFLDLFIFVQTVWLLLRNRYDFVHAHEEAVFFCRFLKPVFRFKLVYDMHSSLPQQLSNFDFTNSKLIHRLFRNLEDTSIRSADAVITICPALAEYVDGVLGKSVKHLLIENSIFDDVKLVTNSRENAGGSESNMSITGPIRLPDGRALVVYTGTLESYQGIDLLVGGFKRVLDAVPKAFLLIVGGSEVQVEHYSALAGESGLNGAYAFTGRVPQKLARHYNGMASVIVSPRSAGTNTPLKVYEQLSMGTPLVATRIYSHTQVLDDDVAFLVEPTEEGLAEGIMDALTDREEAKRKTRNARALYQKKYSRHAYESKMRRLMDLVM